MQVSRRGSFDSGNGNSKGLVPGNLAAAAAAAAVSSSGDKAGGGGGGGSNSNTPRGRRKGSFDRYSPSQGALGRKSLSSAAPGGGGGGSQAKIAKAKKQA